MPSARQIVALASAFAGSLPTQADSLRPTNTPLDLRSPLIAGVWLSLLLRVPGAWRRTTQAFIPPSLDGGTVALLVSTAATSTEKPL
jgi:hypothetical protein